jgi:hypothetical protein
MNAPESWNNSDGTAGFAGPLTSGAQLTAALARADRAEALLKEAVEALRYYADTFCEHSPYDEVCGHLSRLDCSGCRARATIAKIKEAGQ